MAFITTTGERHSTQASANAAEVAQGTNFGRALSGGGGPAPQQQQQNIPQARAKNPYDELISMFRQQQEAARKSIESDFAIQSEDAKEVGAAREAGIKTQGELFRGRSFSGYNQSRIDNEITRTTKSLTRLESAKQGALAQSDANYLSQIAQLEIRALERNDMLEQRSFENALSLRTASLQEGQFGIQKGQFALQQQRAPFELDLLKAQIGSANRSGRQSSNVTDYSQFYSQAFNSGVTPFTEGPYSAEGFSDQFGGLVPQENRLQFTQGYGTWAINNTIDAMDIARANAVENNGDPDLAAAQTRDAIIENAPWLNELLPREYRSYNQETE